MDITRIVLEMIEKRVDDRFLDAKKIVVGIDEKIKEAKNKDKNFVVDLAEKIAKEAKDKFEKELLKKFPKATFMGDNWHNAICFNAKYDCDLNVEYGKDMVREVDAFRGKVLERCKQIAIENSPKTAFGEIDKYLETVDPVKALKLSK